MQAALTIAPPVLPLKPTKNFSHVTFSPPKLGSSSLVPRTSASKATAATVTYDTSTVDYNSSVTSVFPAEACETIGGDACLANIFPETRLESEGKYEARIASEPFEREYLEYNEAKTVFCGEACDDLGGEFCGLEYQRGVY